MKIFCRVFFAIIILSINAQALSPEARLPDLAQEQRAMQLFSEVKCLVCSGQSIESSNTEFSSEMRKLIRQKISEKKSDQEVRNELVKEFGDDVLFSSQKNFILLLSILVFAILLAGFFLRSFFRKF
ncbi:MAG: cytochrome c-type biogenesis protein CcmH [Rickettsiales bacterium]|nr:cytochrome c-type biogenesis protein CcmH [Rickettsiales bacterium]